MVKKLLCLNGKPSFTAPNHNKNYSYAKYQYDPHSYVLNFDQDSLQTTDPETENKYLIHNLFAQNVTPPPSTTTLPNNVGLRSSIGTLFFLKKLILLFFYIIYIYIYKKKKKEKN